MLIPIPDCSNSPDTILQDVQPWARRLIWLAISLGYDIGLAAADLPPHTQRAVKAALERAHGDGVAPWIPAAVAPAAQLGLVLQDLAQEAHDAHDRPD